MIQVFIFINAKYWISPDRILIIKMIKFPIILTLLLVASVTSSNSGCMTYIKTLLDSFVNQDYAALPIPTIMYSGITTNNPGQMY